MSAGIVFAVETAVVSWAARCVWLLAKGSGYRSGYHDGYQHGHEDGEAEGRQLESGYR